MCGRYTLTDPALIWKAFYLDDYPALQENDWLRPRYNIAPTQAVPVVTKTEGKNRLLPCRWGIALPHRGSRRIINARAETVEEKPLFKRNLLDGRCLVPADGYYEWKKENGRKVPYRIAARDGALFAFAGLWGYRDEDQEDGPRYSFVIITTAVSPGLAAIHDRMPAILSGEAALAWLNPSLKEPAEIKKLLVPFPEELLFFYEVSPRVNSPANDTPDCIKPLK